MAPVSFSRAARLAVLAAAVGLAVPALLSLDVNRDRRARLFNHPLAAPPALPELLAAPGPFFRQLNAFLVDGTGLVEVSTKARNGFRFFILGDPPSVNITVNDPFVFMNSDTIDPADRFRVFRESCPTDDRGARAAALIADARAVAAMLRARNMRPVFVVSPGKPRLYADRLPASVPPSLRAACRAAFQDGTAVDDLAAAAEAVGAPVVYPVDAIAARRDEPRFYPPERFHHRGPVGHILARSTFAALGLAVPASYEVAETVVRGRSDLSGFLGFPFPIDLRELDYAAFGVGEPELDNEILLPYYRQPRTLITYRTARPLSRLRAVVFADSFGSGLVPHLAPGFGALSYVFLNGVDPERSGALLDFIARDIAPDIAIVHFHERGFLLGQLKLLLGTDPLAERGGH